MDLRRALVVFFFTIISFNSKAQLDDLADGINERFYAVPQKYLELLSLINRPEILAVDSGLALVKLNKIQIDELANNLHATRPGCGGFTDVHVMMERYGVNVQQALNMEAHPAPKKLTFDKSEPTFPNETKGALGMANPQRMWTFLGQLSAFPDRSAYSDNGVKAAQWLASYGSKLAQDHGRTDVQILNFPTGGSYKQPSVAIRIPGRNPSAPGVLVGGHMDTFDNQKPGSDDDGSGTATVMETYNAILDSGLKFERDIYFAFYAAEERGLVGSRVMVSEFKKRNIPLRSVLQLDMTGFKSPKDTKEVYLIQDHVNPQLTKFLGKLAEVYAGLPAATMGATQCGYACSDHASWTSGGYDSAFPFEASFENDNKTIHTGNDKMDIMNVNHMAKFLKLSTAFVVETADPVQ